MNLVLRVLTTLTIAKGQRIYSLHDFANSIPILRNYFIIDVTFNISRIAILLYGRNLSFVLEEIPLLNNTRVVLSANTKYKHNPTFYQGSVYENGKYVKSKVFGTNWNGQFYGYFTLVDDTYHIQPVRNIHGRSLLYSNSDIVIAYVSKSDYLSFGNSEINQSLDYIESFNSTLQQELQDHRHRYKRHGVFITFGSSCEVNLFADYNFYKDFGESDVTKTTAILTIAFKIADDAFRRSDFNLNDAEDGIGFIIKEITIADESNEYHTFGRDIKDAYKYIIRFKKAFRKPACINVAFTGNAFTDGSVVGLAYKGSTIKSTGVCNRWNVVMIAPKGYYKTYSARIAQTLFHELGHALGSIHDEDNVNTGMNCDGDAKNGRFAMSAYVPAYIKPNSMKFSPCSKSMILPVLVHSRCFVPGKCGNTIIERSESCDCGPESYCDVHDPCCTASDVKDNSGDEPCHYRLSKGKVCSPTTSPCCEETCTVSNFLKICRKASECLRESFCTGYDSVCPESGANDDFTPCSRGLFCSNGTCSLSICDLNHLSPCSCNSSSECTRCCQNSTGSCYPVKDFNIKVINNESLFLASGDPCNSEKGVCDEGHRCSTRRFEHIGSQFADVLPSAIDILLWFGDHFYYFLLGIIFISPFVVAIIRKAMLTMRHASYEAKRIGKFTLVSRSVSVNKKKITKKLEEIEKSHVFDYVETEKFFGEALHRLVGLFPETHVDVLSKVMEMSTSEEVSVRLLILRGCPFVRLFSETTCHAVRTPLTNQGLQFPRFQSVDHSNDINHHVLNIPKLAWKPNLSNMDVE